MTCCTLSVGGKYCLLMSCSADVRISRSFLMGLGLCVCVCVCVCVVVLQTWMRRRSSRVASSLDQTNAWRTSSTSLISSAGIFSVRICVLHGIYKILSLLANSVIITFNLRCACNAVSDVKRGQNAEATEATCRYFWIRTHGHNGYNT